MAETFWVLPKVPSHILPDEVNRLKLIKHPIACPFLIQQLNKKKTGNQIIGTADNYSPFVIQL